MFSLLRVGQRSPRLLPSQFSTTCWRSKTPDDNAKLLGVLDEEAQKQEGQAYSAKPSGERTPRNKPEVRWKPFAPNTSIKPYSLTYKARVQGPRPFKKRPLLGPPSRVSRHQDVFHQLGIDPLEEALNPTLLSGFMSDMGKVFGRNITGLTTRNQRRLGKAIRRAKMMGVIPILSRPHSQRSWS